MSGSAGGSYHHRWYYRDTNFKAIHISLGYRRTLDSRNVLVSIPEFQMNIGGYYIAVRLPTLIEPRAKETDHFGTTDIQFFGFQTYPKGRWVFNASTGVLVENYNGNAFIESVVGLRYQVKDKYRFYSEARGCLDGSTWIRTEGTLGAEATVYTTKYFRIGATAFFTSALYYEKVPVEGYGLGLNVHF